MIAALFYLFAAAAMASAVGVVACRNLVRSAVCLLFTLVAVAGIYLLLDAEFLAAVQLVVYTGGILILIIFGILLTSSSPLARYSPSPGEIAAACGLAAVLLLGLVVVIHTSAFLVKPDAPQPTINDLGQALIGDYVFPFELASVLLLVVMIGAAFVARGKRTPSRGILAEGRGEGAFESQVDLGNRRNPDPNPLPEYREREPEGVPR
jgi:NADH:ubiquinone oxidoreductase subunit 6 (subunit J)